LSVDTIKEFNNLVLNNLKLEARVKPGEIRNYGVAVANRYEAPPAEECEYLLQRLCDWLNKDEMFQVPAGKPRMVIVYAILKAVLAHLYLAWIHPFGDGNGRTARLVEFFLLIASSVPAPAANLFSNHYNQTRNEYYRQLDQASKSGGDVLPFIEYALQGFVDGLAGQLKYIQFQQWELAWKDYVHMRLPDDSTRIKRRRHLVLDLSAQTKPVVFDKLLEISPRIALDYANRHTRTLSRDLQKLMEMKLIRFEDGYIANKVIVLGMLPFVADPITK
jgi:hypothetical protein